MAGFALSAAGAVTGFESQSVQAEAQSKMYAQNSANATRAFADTNTALSINEEQQQAATGQQLQQNALKTQAAQATALAAGAAGGVQGHSLEDILGDFGARNAQATQSINTQAGWNLAQTEQEKVGAADQTVSRINSMTPGMQPTFLDAGLRIAQAGIGAETSYGRNQYYGNGGQMYNPLNGAGA